MRRARHLKILIKFEGKAQKNTFFNILSTSIYTTKNPSEFSSDGLCINLNLFRKLRLAGGTENIDDLMHVELFELVAGGAEILAGVEFSGLGGEHFAHFCRHSQSAVGVDVDFADCGFRRLAELLFGNADCGFELSAVLVYHVNILLRN